MTDRGGVPDLVMRVVERKDARGTSLLFTLVSPGGGQRDILGRRFEGDAEAFRERLLGTLSSLVSARKLDGLGRYLWRELFPPELQAAYREFRTKITSWMILSDEPWIPWELVKPYSDDASGEPFDDDFLGLAFQLTRWLTGDLDPARQIAVNGVAGLRTDRNLPLAAQETAFLAGIASARGVRAIDRFVGTSDEIVGHLADLDFQLLHLVGHGRRSGAKWEAGLPLADDEVFVPSELEGPLASQLRRRRPMVFLNACWAGHETRSLTHLAGWAPTWVQVCGCGAFVAPIWPVRDSIACRFSEEFYQALAEGRSLGEAAQLARRSAFSLGDGEPSALAYAVYGLPGAQVSFGSGPIPEEEEGPIRRRSVPSLKKASARSGRKAARRVRSTLRVKKFWLPIAVALFALAGVRFGKDWFSRPAEESFGPTSLGQPLPTPKPKPPAPPKPTTISVEGASFEIHAASGDLKRPLSNGLRGDGESLEEAGLAGWSIHVEVGTPQVTSHSLGGFSEQSCRLVARCRARRNGPSIDLGTVEAVNSQVDRATACEAAAEDLGKSVIRRLVTELRKESQ